ncbi:MAG: ankyrin repeat domain-containing protein, partial [Pseudomonadota bacterium]
MEEKYSALLNQLANLLGANEAETAQLLQLSLLASPDAAGAWTDGEESSENGRLLAILNRFLMESVQDNNPELFLSKIKQTFFKNKDPIEANLLTALLPGGDIVSDYVLSHKLTINVGIHTILENEENTRIFSELAKNTEHNFPLFYGYITVKKDEKTIGNLFYGIITNNYYDKLRTLLKSGVEVNLYAENGQNPAVTCAMMGNVRMLKLLAQAGADLAAPVKLVANRRGDTPLQRAITNKHEAAIKYLIEQRAGLCGLDSNGKGAVITALEFGQFNIAHLILTTEKPTDPKEIATNQLYAMETHNFSAFCVFLYHYPDFLTESNNLSISQVFQTEVPDIKCHFENLILASLSIYPYSTVSRILGENSPKIIKSLLKIISSPKDQEKTLSDLRLDYEKNPRVLQQKEAERAALLASLDKYFLADPKSPEQAIFFAETEAIFAKLEPGCPVIQELALPAAKTSHPDVIRFLARYGADFSQRDALGVSPAMLAAAGSMRPVLLALKDAGIDLAAEFRIFEMCRQSQIDSTDARYFLGNQKITDCYKAAGVNVDEIKAEIAAEIAEAERARLQTQTEADLA